MDLRNAKLGDRFRVFLDDEGKLTHIPNMRTIPATVIAVKPSNDDTKNFILGWRKDEERPTDAMDRRAPDPKNQYVANQALYVTGSTVDRKMPVAVQIIHGLDGFPCTKCTNFYQYALPNQKDGTLVCWSCRHSW